MKGKAKTVFLIITLVLVFSIIFGLYFTLFYGRDKNEIKFNNPSLLVESYVSSLINEDYVRAYQHINLPYNSFVNKDDYIKYIKQKKYYNQLVKYNTITSIDENEALAYIVTLEDNKGNLIKLDINLIERTVNDYRVDESDLYVENFKLTVPKGTKVTIDDMLVNEDALNKSDKYNDIYILPTIAKNNKKFVLENELGSKEMKIYITENTKEKSINIELSNNELKNRAYNYIKETWNEICECYEQDKDVSEVKKYFDESIEESKIKAYYETGLKKISTSVSSLSDFRDFDIVDMVDNPNESNYVTTNDIITLNFGYKLSWNWYNSNSNIFLAEYYMTRYSSIRLKIVGDSFIIYDVVDNGLFTYASQYTRDY